MSADDVHRRRVIWFKHACMQVCSGAFAGLVEISVFHPLDVIKTRLQVQKVPGRSVSADDPTNYRGVADCTRKMVRAEGVLSLWKGVLPPILMEMPRRSVLFFTFEQSKPFFMSVFEEEQPSPYTFAASGLLAGIVEGWFVNPFEVVKVNLQADRARGHQMPSTLDMAKKIYRKHGAFGRGLNRALVANMYRHGVFHTFYLGIYHSGRTQLPVLEDPVQEFLKKCALGFIGGTVGSCINIPFDVAKSRIQGPQPSPPTRPYHGTGATIVRVAREEGFFALYKGLIPKVLRLGPGGALLLLVYEFVYRELNLLFPD